MSEDRKWAKIQGLTSEKIYYLDKKRVVSRLDLTEKWRVDTKTIARYLEKGMPIHPASTPMFQVFVLDEVTQWRMDNVGMSIKTTPPPNGDDPEDTTHAGRKQKADADKAVEDAVIAQLKRKQLEGSLIESETLDLAQAEQAVIYQTLYSNDKKILPTALKNRTDSEIRQYLDVHYSNRMEDLDKFIQKVWPDGTDHLSDLIYTEFRKAVDEA